MLKEENITYDAVYGLLKLSRNELEEMVDQRKRKTDCCNKAIFFKGVDEIVYYEIEFLKSSE